MSKDYKFTETLANECGVVLGEMEIGKIRYSEGTDMLRSGWIALGKQSSGFAWDSKNQAAIELISFLTAGAVYGVTGSDIRWTIIGQHDGQFVMQAENPGELLPQVLFAAPEELSGAVYGGQLFLVDTAPIQ